MPERRYARDAGRARTMLLLVVAILGVGALAYAAVALTSGGGAANRTGAVVWALGDGADGGERARTLATRVLEDRPDRFLYLGDVYEHGTAEEFADNYAPAYGPIARITAPTPGDHEWGNRREGYDPYWHRARGRPMPPWSSFEQSGWEIYNLNSEAPHGAGSEQVRWLRSRLDGATGTCRLAFWHRPRYSAGSHGDYEDVEPLWDAVEGRAAAVLSGDDHNLQRHEPRDGTTQFVVGAGGHSNYDVDDDYDDPLAFVDTDSTGALRLELSPGLARFEFVSADGEVLDSGELPCTPNERGAAAGAPPANG